MWEQYTTSSDSVAVATTPYRISRGLRYPRYVSLHRMQYTDEPYPLDCSPGDAGSMDATILHKRPEFRHEQEVRLVAARDTALLMHAGVSDSKTGERIEGWRPDDDGPPHLLHINAYRDW